MHLQDAYLQSYVRACVHMSVSLHTRCKCVTEFHTGIGIHTSDGRAPGASQNMASPCTASCRTASFCPKTFCIGVPAEKTNVAACKCQILTFWHDTSRVALATAQPAITPFICVVLCVAAIRFDDSLHKIIKHDLASQSNNHWSITRFCFHQI